MDQILENFSQWMVAHGIRQEKEEYGQMGIEMQSQLGDWARGGENSVFFEMVTRWAAVPSNRVLVEGELEGGVTQDGAAEMLKTINPAAESFFQFWRGEFLNTWLVEQFRTYLAATNEQSQFDAHQISWLLERMESDLNNDEPPLLTSAVKMSVNTLKTLEEHGVKWEGDDIRKFIKDVAELEGAQTNATNEVFSNWVGNALEMEKNRQEIIQKIKQCLAEAEAEAAIWRQVGMQPGEPVIVVYVTNDDTGARAEGRWGGVVNSVAQGAGGEVICQVEITIGEPHMIGGSEWFPISHIIGPGSHVVVFGGTVNKKEGEVGTVKINPATGGMSCIVRFDPEGHHFVDAPAVELMPVALIRGGGGKRKRKKTKTRRRRNKGKTKRRRRRRKKRTRCRKR